jgi:hypothetical protein
MQHLLHLLNSTTSQSHCALIWPRDCATPPQVISPFPNGDEKVSYNQYFIQLRWQDQLDTYRRLSTLITIDDPSYTPIYSWPKNLDLNSLNFFSISTAELHTLQSTGGRQPSSRHRRRVDGFFRTDDSREDRNPPGWHATSNRSSLATRF